MSAGRGGALRRWLWIGVLAAGVWGYGRAQVAPMLGSAPFTGRFHGNDFKHIYLGAWMLDQGRNPYDAADVQLTAARRGFSTINPYVYLPFTGIVMTPLARLDPPEALRVWFVLNHLFVLGGLALAFRSLGLRPTWRDAAVWGCVAAWFYPLTRTLTAGQLNCALFFLFALVYALWRRGWAVAAGVVAAFAFLYKLAPGILLAWFLWRGLGEVLAARSQESGRRRSVVAAALGSPALRAAAVMVVATGLFLGLSVAKVGWPTHLAFRPLLEQMGYGRSTWAEFGNHFHRDPENQSLNSLFHHLVAAPGGEGEEANSVDGTNGRDGANGKDGKPGSAVKEEGGTTPWVDLGAHWANGLTRVAFLVCAVVVLWRTRPRRRGHVALQAPVCADTDASLSYGLFVLLGLLAPSIYWDHYAVIALWPLLAAYARLPERVRAGAFVVAMGALAPLSAYREWAPVVTWGCVAVSFGAAVWLVATRRGAGVAGAAWGLATALLGARFLFGAPELRQGAGLIAMSIGLWGTLVLFGVLVVGRAPRGMDGMDEMDGAEGAPAPTAEERRDH